MARNPRVYLASRSPRRRQLLAQIGVAFDPLVLDERALDTARLSGETADAYVGRAAHNKAEAAWQLVVERRLVRQPALAAHTSIEIGGRVVGKPRDADDARRMLRHLAGKHHRVLTAVAIAADGRVEVRLAASDVFLAPIDEAQIGDYVASGEPLDKAGAYAIDGRAGRFVEHFAGSYSGILGLPLFETAELLRLLACLP